MLVTWGERNENAVVDLFMYHISRYSRIEKEGWIS